MKLNFEVFLFLLITILWYAIINIFNLDIKPNLIEIAGFSIAISLLGEINKKLK